MDRQTKDHGGATPALCSSTKGLIWGLKNYENVASVVDLALLTG